MFSWICPQCGREVSPSYTECPDCKKRGLAGPGAQPPQTQPGAPPPPGYPGAPPVYQGPPQQPAYQGQPQQPVYQAPPQQPVYQAPPPQPPVYQPPSQPVYQAPPQQPVYQQPQQPVYQAPPQPPPAYQTPPYQAAPPDPVYQQQPPVYQAPQPVYESGPQTTQAYAVPYPPRRTAGNMPTWLLTVLFALGFVALVGGIYWGVGYMRGGSSSAATPPSNVESPAAKPGAKTSSMQKYIEVSGIRFTQDAKKNLQVKFTLTNHSDADISGLAGNVTIWGRTQKSEEDAVGTFSFTGDIGPQTSREFTAPLSTKLKVYELPDWQNVTTDLQITAPQ